jgi:hypothetical protein
MPLPSLRLITAGEKSESFTDRPGHLMKGTLKGCDMDYRTYQNLRGYCWQDLSPYIDTKSSNDTLEIKRLIAGNRADIQHEHAAAMGLFQTSDLTPRERAAAHLLAMISNHRATAWYREPVTPDGKPPAEPLEAWQASELWAQTRLAVTEYAAFIPEREALALLALVSEQNTAPEQEVATPGAVVNVGVSIAQPKQRAQETQILERLKTNGYDPLKLAQGTPGRAGPKSAIRQLVMTKPTIFTKSSFDKAWERLRSDGSVADAE